MSIESVMPSNHLILCHLLLLLPSIFPRIRIFSNELVPHIRWPNIGDSTSASVFPMNIRNWFPLRLPGLISLLSKGLSRIFFSTTSFIPNYQLIFNPEPTECQFLIRGPCSGKGYWLIFPGWEAPAVCKRTRFQFWQVSTVIWAMENSRDHLLQSCSFQSGKNMKAWNG